MDAKSSLAIFRLNGLLLHPVHFGCWWTLAEIRDKIFQMGFTALRFPTDRTTEPL